MKKILEKTRFAFIFMACLVLILLPMALLAAPDNGNGSEFHLVVCGTGDAGAMDCDFEKLKELVSKTFDYVLGYIILPVATILIIYAGFKTILESSQGKDPSFYKTMLKNVLIGMAMAIGAYALVKTFINLFFDSDGAFQPIIEEVFGNN